MTAGVLCVQVIRLGRWAKPYALCLSQSSTILSTVSDIDTSGVVAYSDLARLNPATE